jgi:hypothetical protein
MVDCSIGLGLTSLLGTFKSSLEHEVENNMAIKKGFIINLNKKKVLVTLLNK